MAKKARRVIINLTCNECKQRNYTTTKSREISEPLNLNRYCPWCRKHTLHEEEKIDKKRN